MNIIDSIANGGLVSRGSNTIMPNLVEPALIGEYLQCDVIIGRETAFNSDVTEYPVEDGFSISDHVIRKPLTLSLDVLFTPTPVTWNSVIGGHSLNTVANQIMQIYEAGEPVTIKLHDAIYTDMIMTSAPLPRKVEDGYCYKCQLNFTHVRRVIQRSEDVPEEYAGADASGKAGKTETDAGAASTMDIGGGTGNASDDARAAASAQQAAHSKTGMTTVEPSGAKKSSIYTSGIDLSQYGSFGVGLEARAYMAMSSLSDALGRGGILW